MTHDLGRECEGLPEDLYHLAAELDSPPIRIEPLRTPNSPRTRPGAFRVHLADGGQLKARVMINDARAAKIDYILRHLRHPFFPEVVARRGRVMLLEWIDGEPAANGAASPELLRACGAIHAFIHMTPVPEECGYRPADPLRSARDKLRGDLDGLVAAGVLQASESRCILDLEARFAPVRCDVGFVHRDFCPDNIVIRPSGEICAIDNETLSMGALDFDLARTWYRWPMEPGERRHYFGVYSSRRDIGDLLAHFPFWALAVLVDSIALRLGADAADRSLPVDRLRALLEALRKGVAPERLAFES